MTDIDIDGPPSYGLEAPIGRLTMLDGLLTDLAQHPALNDHVEFDLAARPGWAVRCSTDVPYENLAAWRKGALDAAMAGGTNEVKLACSVLLHACTALLKDGEVVTDQGEPVTLTTPALLQMLGASRPADAVRALFVRDGFLTSTAQSLLREAGYGAEATPTRR